MKKLTAQMATMMFSRFVTLFSSMLSGVIVARYFGVDVYGIYAIASVFLSTIAIFFDCGFDLAFISMASKDEKNFKYYFGNSLLIKVFAIFIAFIVAIIVPKFIGYDMEVRKLILLLFVSVLLPTINSTFITELQIKGKIAWVAIMNIIRSFLYLGAAIIILIIEGDIYSYCLFQSLAAIIIMIIFIIILEDRRIRIKLSLILSLLKEVTSFGISTYLHIMYQRIPIMLLTYYAPAVQIGLFDAANRITNSAYQSISAIEGATIPAMFKANNEDKESISPIFVNIITFIGLLAFYVCSTFVILGDEIIIFLYGIEYSEAANIFKILSFSIFILFFAPAFGSLISASGAIKKKIKLQIIILIVCIISVFPLVLNLNGVGVALSNLIVAITTLIVYSLYVCKNFNINKGDILLVLIKFAICTALTSVILILLGNTSLHVIVKIIISGIVYIGVVGIFFRKNIKGVIKG